MGGGKRAAEAIDRYLTQNEPWPAPEVFERLSAR
jgi:hypothetical protein